MTHCLKRGSAVFVALVVIAIVLPAGEAYGSEPILTDGNPDYGYLQVWWADLDLSTAEMDLMTQVAPGQVIEAGVDFTIWDNYNPSAIWQVIIVYSWAIPPGTTYNCLYNGIPGNEPGVSINTTWTFEVPTTPGLYEIGIYPGAFYSCQQSADAIHEMPAILARVLVGEPGPTPFELAKHYAPIWHQGTTASGEHRDRARGKHLYRQDYITNFTFDGNYNAYDNWENMEVVEYLNATIYYSVVESETHWFLGYWDFHPRDWKPRMLRGFLAGHENDMEGALLVVKKDGNWHGSLLLMQTYAHFVWYSYSNTEEVRLNEVIPEIYSSPLLPNVELRPMLVDGSHPILYVESGGHGVYGHRPTGFRNTMVVYRYSGIPEEPEGGDDRDVGYALESVDDLWERRSNPETFENIGYFGEDLLRSELRASPPWGMCDGDLRIDSDGEVFYDPAKVIDLRFEGLGDFSHEYIYTYPNPYEREWNNEYCRLIWFRIGEPDFGQYISGEVVNQNIKVYVDGDLLFEVEDLTFVNGSVGLETSTGGGSWTEITSYFDNIEVYDCSEQLLTDDFEDGNAQGWNVYSGDATVQLGNLDGSGLSVLQLHTSYAQVGDPTIGTVVYENGLEWRGYTFEADAKIVDSNDAWSYLNFHFNSQSNTNPRENAYEVYLKAQQDQVTLVLWVDGVHPPIPLPTVSYDIDIGVTYHVKIVIEQAIDFELSLPM